MGGPRDPHHYSRTTPGTPDTPTPVHMYDMSYIGDPVSQPSSPFPDGPRDSSTSTMAGDEDPLRQEQNLLQPTLHVDTSTPAAFTAQCVSKGFGREASESTDSSTVSSTMPRRFFEPLHMSPTGFVDGVALSNLLELDSPTSQRFRTPSTPSSVETLCDRFF